MPTRPRPSAGQAAAMPPTRRRGPGRGGAGGPRRGGGAGGGAPPLDLAGCAERAAVVGGPRPPAEAERRDGPEGDEDRANPESRQQPIDERLAADVRTA